MEQIKRTRIEFIETCPICKHEIKSLVKSQTEFNFKLHLESCKKKEKERKDEAKQMTELID